MSYGCIGLRFSILCRVKAAHIGRVYFSKCCRLSATTDTVSQDGLRTRNIGIIAHIDAGKTTTTERMLYYSGHTRRIGDVDEGSTVTDFLPAERARGITIQSAAITFYWPPQTEDKAREESKLLKAVHEKQHLPSDITHCINLIDTPGHADFTFEVRRSLRVLDGTICVLDGVAGVEAQTEQVWSQAADWNIPRIVYVNKLDRDGAAFGRTVREVGLRLQGWPAVCHIPWFEHEGKGRFCGIADVVNLCGLLYERGDGKVVQRFSLQELSSKEPILAKELERARVALVERLSEHDEVLIEAFLDAKEDHLALSPIQITESLRRCLLSNTGKVIPVFAGASFRNIGVQPLLDAVNNLLPNPDERPSADISINGITTGTINNLLRGDISGERLSAKTKNQPTHPIEKTLRGCALVFKVVNDAKKGILAYFRVYAGSIDRNSLLYNTSLGTSERASTLLQMYANESIPIQSVEAGQIGVIAGSKSARTGDTLISTNTNKPVPPEPLHTLQLRPIHVPPPVFFASIEPNSLKDEKDMHDKLALLLREDPSLHVTQDEDTGQTLLSGMGELHLEIARDRLVQDLKANATMGKITIGYRETLVQPSPPVTKIFDSSTIRGGAEVKGKAGCTAQVAPLSDDQIPESKSSVKHTDGGNVIVIDTPHLRDGGRRSNEDATALPPHLSLREVQQAYINGALAALARGPSFSYPMCNIVVTLTLDPSAHIFDNETTLSSLTSAARLATINAFREVQSSAGVALMEPVMLVDISVDNASLGTVVHDISSSRGGQIISLGDHEEAETSTATEVDVNKIYAPPDPFESGTSHASLDHHSNRPRIIKARVPLKEMVGYLKHLRSMTGGRGTFTMTVDRFERVTGQREKTLIAELRGSA